MRAELKVVIKGNGQKCCLPQHWNNSIGKGGKANPAGTMSHNHCKEMRKLKK